MNGSGDEAVRLADFVAPLDPLTYFGDQLGGLARVLAEGKYYLIRIRHAPYPDVFSQFLQFGWVDPMPKREFMEHLAWIS
jgi:hypothetical protein